MACTRCIFVRGAVACSEEFEVQHLRAIFCMRVLTAASRRVMQVAGALSVATPNIDELVAMATSVVASQGDAETQLRTSSLSRETLTAIEALSGVKESVLVDGHLVDPRPLAPALEIVMSAILKSARDVRAGVSFEGAGAAQPQALLRRRRTQDP